MFIQATGQSASWFIVAQIFNLLFVVQALALACTTNLCTCAGLRELEACGMRFVRMRLFIGALLLLKTFGCLEVAAVTSIAFSDLNGHRYYPLESGTNLATVFIFILADCPVANSYAPEINRLVAEYTPKRVQFFLVHVDDALTEQEASQHARDFGYQCPVLIDRDHALVQRTGATITPEAAVLGRTGERLYRGRIDNQQAALGKRRPRPTTRELRDALDAILAHKPVKHPETKAVGCYIPPLAPSKK